MSAHRLQFEHFEVEMDEHGSPVRLGGGGMGTTFKAFDTRRRKHVALKIINEHLLADQKIRRRFFNEARAAANLEHPNVVRVDHVSSEDAETCFFAMEWVDGESLHERVKKGGPLPPREALLLLRAVADALSALGEQRLVHRDIKPENIMIARAARAAARVKLIDFGLAKALEQSLEHLDSMHTGERFVGSALFASPEQIRARGVLDCRSDFYSLGATLWYVLAGLPPFTGTIFEVQEGHVHEDPPWEKVAHLPLPMRSLLGTLLAKDPAERPADAEALLAHWDATLAALDSSQSPGEPTAPAPDQSGGIAYATRATVSAPAEPLVAVEIEHVEEGCTPPPAHAHLARDATSGDWLIARRVPPALPAALRGEFTLAAQAAAHAPHSGFLNVREVREEEVVSEWPPSITATRLLASQRGALPLEVVLAWLPKLARTIDRASSAGLSRLGLAPAHWHVSFKALSAGETPIARAALSPYLWGPHYVFLDPLAGFDPEFAAASTTGLETLVPQSVEVMKSPADFLAAFARGLHELLGGRDREHLAPLPSLDQAGNELLFAAIRGDTRFASVAQWAEAFTQCATPERKVSAPAKTPVPAREVNAPVPSAVRPRRWTFPFRKVWPAISGAVPTKIWLAVAAMLAVGGIGWVIMRGIATAREASLEKTVAAASVDAPFVNSLGMKFVPVPIETGASAGQRVLFGVWPTRVQDFAAFVEATHHDATNGMASMELTKDGWGFRKDGRNWKSPGFEQTGLHPVGGISREDAEAFCAWLSSQEHSARALPKKLRYRLPSDHEWSCAAGIGDKEDFKVVPAGKSQKLPDLFPWGNSQQPPAGAGNYAGEEFTAGMPRYVPCIAGYNDHFPRSSPVGSFTANRFGLFDMGGNVSQWCSDPYLTASQFGVLRGAAWYNHERNVLLTSNRTSALPTARQIGAGFRCVLAPVAP